MSFRYLEDGTKVRVAKRSGAIIPRPEILKERRTPAHRYAGPYDTSAEDAVKETIDLYERAALEVADRA